MVFSIGLCALTGIAQQWINVVGTPLFVCRESSAFLGFIGAILGLAGLFGKDRSRAATITGLGLGLMGVCMFAGILLLAGK